MTTMPTPEVYESVNGTTTVTQEGSITYGSITLPQSKLTPSSKESLVSLQTLSDQGYTYVHSKKGAVLLHEDEKKCVELVPVQAGNAILYRLPIGESGTRLADLEVQHAIMLAAKVQQDREKRMLLEHQIESHIPVCRDGSCWDCLMATAKKPPSTAKGDTPVSGTA